MRVLSISFCARKLMVYDVCIMKGNIPISDDNRLRLRWECDDKEVVVVDSSKGRSKTEGAWYGLYSLIVRGTIKLTPFFSIKDDASTAKV